MDTMGKKSKKQPSGGAKGKGSVSTEPNGGASANCDGTGGGTLTSNGGKSSKKERCVLCCALLKDLAKAHAAA